MKFCRILTLATAALLALTSFAAKITKIKLTGSLYEPIVLTVGNGRTETVSSLPYTLEVEKNSLPLKLKVSSDNFLYYDIDIPKKPFDSTGHVYLIKINETAMQLRGGTLQQQVVQPVGMPASPVQQVAAKTSEDMFDTSFGVNAAPLTSKKSENTFVLIIANEKYEVAADVENASSDGRAFKEYCVKTLGVPNENVRFMTNLSYGRMKKSLNDILDLAEMLNGKAQLLLYYAGHGIPDNKTKDAFLMPVDADGTDTDLCISLAELYSNINSKALDRCVVFLDACFSGAQRGGDMIVAARGVKLKPKEVVPEGKTIVFSATSDDEAAFSHKDEKHGLFTYFLLKKLQESKGKVNLGELADYLVEKVSFESRRINNAPQTPTVMVAESLSDKWKKLSLTE